MIKRNAKAIWNGSLTDGGGSISTGSGTLDETQYGFKSRFENGEAGTNPEELIAAAHSGCYSMALSAILGGHGFTPDSVETQAVVTLDKVDDNWTIVKSELTVTASVPGISEDDFLNYANEAKANCPISRVLNAEITLTANLTTTV